MNRLFTSLALLVATLVPAQAGLLDWGNVGSSTTLTGAGNGTSTLSALFTYDQGTGNTGLGLQLGDIVCGIFDFGTVNGRDIFGLMKAQVINTTAGVQFQGLGGSGGLEGSLGTSGFDVSTLNELDNTVTPMFALFSSTTSQDLASVANASDATLGISTSAFELDLLAGDLDGFNNSPDELRFLGDPSNAPSASDTGLADFLLALTVSDTNGSATFEDTSYSATLGGTTFSGSTDLVVSGTLGSLSGTDQTGFTYEISSGTQLQFTAVPEPSSLAILGLVGVAGTAMRRRRK